MTLGRIGQLTLLVCIVMLPHGASALGTSSVDGNEMLKKCLSYVHMLDSNANPSAISEEDAVDGAYCVGYVNGMVDDRFYWQMNEGSTLDPLKHFCLPDGVSPNQTVRVFIKWLQDNPARLHEHASHLLIDALRDGFPCRKQQ